MVPAAGWSDTLVQDVADEKHSRGTHERDHAKQSFDKVRTDYSPPSCIIQEVRRQATERQVPPASRVSIPIDSGITSLTFGEILVVGCEDGTVRYWDPLVGRVDLRKLEPSHQQQVNCVTISPDGRWLASCGRGNSEAINIWDLSPLHGTVEGPTHSKNLVGHSKTIRRISFSHNGAMLASCAADGVRIWNLLNGNSFFLASTPIATAKDPCCVAMSDDGLRLALATKSGRIIVIRNSSGKVERTFKSDDGPTMAICFHPNGDMLATTGADRVIKLWDTNGRIVSQHAVLEEASKDLAFSPDGSLLLSGGKGKRTGRRAKSAIHGAPRGQKVLLWAWNGVQLVLTEQRSVNATVRCVAFSGTGELAAYATGTNDLTGASVYLWNVARYSNQANLGRRWRRKK